MPGRPVFLLTPGRMYWSRSPNNRPPEGLACIEMLEPDQQGRDVVPGSGIEPDILDADLAEHLLRIAYLSHACLVKIGRNRPDLVENGPKPAYSPDSST